MEEERIVIAGFGGQGIMFLGKLLCHAGMLDGRHITYLPSYGVEVRGGTACCNVIISSEEIASPVITSPTTAIIMNTPSMIRYEPEIVKRGLLIVNSSIVDRHPKRKDIGVVMLPATTIADRMGNTRVANMVALGGFLSKSQIVKTETVLAAVGEVLPPYRQHLAELNRRAILEGKAAADAQGPDAIWSKITRGFGLG
ncbi:MAG: 2-oxoacid:acceptor oxidoreductase family protein [bacterium]|nr:2-oxoacid:acceptor oxidoreductase family protein [bacterium]